MRIATNFMWACVLKLIHLNMTEILETRIFVQAFEITSFDIVCKAEGISGVEFPFEMMSQ